MQLKTSTPRLILFFSGTVFFVSINMLFLNWWCGLICIAAGFLPAIYEFIKHGKLIKKSPRQWQRNGNLLIIAGVIECIIMAYGIYKFLNNLNRALLFNMQDVDYYNIAISIAHGICIAVFCFLRYRRTSVLYRIFLIAPSVVGIILIPGQIAVTLIGMATSDHFSTTWSPIEAILFLAPTLLILIHALKTRHDGILPQEPEADMQQPLTSVV